MYEIGCFRQLLFETISFCLLEEQVSNDLMPPSKFFQSLAQATYADINELCDQIDENALRPLAPFRKFSPTLGRLLSLRDKEMDELVHGISIKRKAVISNAAAVDSTPAKGRILYFEPSLSLFDGAAMVASGGFFDVETFPPSDTWIAYVGEEPNPRFLSGYILSWVPESLVELIDGALKVDPLESIRWAQTVNKPFLNELREADLLP